jgi:lysophospholipase L1-like esterase
MSPSLRVLSLAAIALLVPTLGLRAEIAVKSGDKIAFLGDSITQDGWASPTGYLHLVISGLKANGIDAEPVPAGISGHKSNQMLARLQKDVLDKHPQWMTLSCGVNDVWHGKNGVPLDDAQAASGEFVEKAGDPPHGTYKKNIAEILDKTKEAGVKTIVLTSTVIQENLESSENQKLAPYNEFLRAIAKERALPLADLSALFHERLKAENKPDQKVLTRDGVHMNYEGNKIMATGILQAMGLDAAELAKAQASWPASAPAK